MKDSSGDNWHKPRKTSQHLTDAEISVIRTGFINRTRIELVARQLECASRTVTKYYGYFRAEGLEQVKKKERW